MREIAGWTGQPLLIKENGEPYLIQGASNHHKKIRAKTGKLIWQYKFDDVIKGTARFGTTQKPQINLQIQSRAFHFNANYHRE